MVTACGGGDDDDGADGGRLQVVASTGVIAHFTEQIAGDDADVVSVIPAGADAHSFSATTTDIRNISAADIVIVNGYNLEEGALGTIFEHIPDDAQLVIAAAGISPLEGGHHEEQENHGDEDADEVEAEDHDEDEEGDEEEGHGDEDEDEEGDRHEEEIKVDAEHELAVADGDPHMWLTVPNAMVYVRNIANGLVAADPDNASVYREREDAYLAGLQALDEEVRATIAGIPPERRVLIVYHDAFQYFAAEYGLELGRGGAAGQPLAAGERRRRRPDHRDRRRAQCGRRLSRAAVRRRRARRDRRGGGRAGTDAVQWRLHG